MKQDFPPALNRPINRRVLSYLQDLSAHSDIASLLADAVKPLGDVQTFCPDPASYRYVCVSTQGILFGFAVGMDTLAFRLDARMKSRALATGGVSCPECGDDWVAVVHPQPDSDWPKVDVRFWALKSYVWSRETNPG